MQLYTASRGRAAQGCRREHYFKYELRRRPIAVAEPLTFGRLYHAGLEQWWLAWQDINEGEIGANTPPEYALDLMIAGFRAAAMAGLDGEVDDYLLVKVEALLLGYHHRWKDWAATVEVLAVEPQFDAPLVNPATGKASRTWRLGGKIDLIVKLPNSEVWLVEHKTTSKNIAAGSSYWQLLRMDPQISTYFEGGTSLGHEIVGCIYDVVKKPGLKPKEATPEENRKFTKGKGCKWCGGSAGGKAGVQQGRGRVIGDQACPSCNGSGWKEEPRLHADQRTEDESLAEYAGRLRKSIAADPDGYYQMGDVVRLESELDEHRADTWATAKAIRETQLLAAAGYMPARNPDSCLRFERFCAYWDCCVGNADIDDDMRFRRTRQHPELNISDDPKEKGNP